MIFRIQVQLVFLLLAQSVCSYSQTKSSHDNRKNQKTTQELLTKTDLITMNGQVYSGILMNIDSTNVYLVAFNSTDSLSSFQFSNIKEIKIQNDKIRKWEGKISLTYGLIISAIGSLVMAYFFSQLALPYKPLQEWFIKIFIPSGLINGGIAAFFGYTSSGKSYHLIQGKFSQFEKFRKYVNKLKLLPEQHSQISLRK